nr:hypothetical protein BaRGS_034813 [Batillaria attramentaria]
MADKYKLIYFDGKGRGELTRLVFTAADARFEEKRFGFQEWPTIKPTTPSDSVPVLEVNGKAYAESGAFPRVLARKYGLAGKKEDEELVVEAILTQEQQILNGEFFPYLFQKDEAKKRAQGELIKNDTVKALQLWEKKATESSGPFFVSSGLTVADLAVFDLIDQLEGGKLPGLDLSKFPKVKGVIEAVKTHPKISAYLKKRTFSLPF